MWQYTDSTKKVIKRLLEDGRIESRFTTSEDVAVDADVPVPTKDDQDVQQLKLNNVLNALQRMSPSEVDAWIQTNVTNLAQAKQVLAMLAGVVAILSRKL